MINNPFRICVLIFLLVSLTYHNSFAIFISADFSPWQAVDAAFRTVNDKIAIANKSNVVQKTIQLVKVYRDAKNITGDIAATWKDMQDFEANLLGDLKSITSLSKEHQIALNEFFSWKETFNGNRGKSLLEINRFYSTVTNEFRDREGNLNVAQTLYSHVISDEERYRKTKSWESFVNSMNEASKLYYDQMFREKLNQAKLLDMEAYKESVILNYEVFKGRAKNLVSDINGLKSNDYMSQKKINGVGTLSENEISTRQIHILELQHKGSMYRMEAFQILNLVIELERESFTDKQRLHNQYRAWLRANNKNFNPNDDAQYQSFLIEMEKWKKEYDHSMIQ